VLVSPLARFESELPIACPNSAKGSDDLRLRSRFRQGWSVPRTKQQTFNDMQQAGDSLLFVGIVTRIRCVTAGFEFCRIDLVAPEQLVEVGAIASCKPGRLADVSTGQFQQLA
jgi:hypothetical protein